MQGDFSEAMLGWFELYGRHDLPWQDDKSAYRVWLSEIMLQQTQVATVIPYYQRFLNRFPTISRLADASIDEVLQLWQGLGYYARARNLHCAAQIMRDQHGGEFPTSMEDALNLPGVGRSTAAAILTFACDQSWPILDGNVKRVLARCYQVAGWYGQTATMKQLWQLAETNTPDSKTDDYNQAMMDLGATVCLKSKPKCDECPLTSHCLSFEQQTQSLFPEKKPKKNKPHKNTLMLLHRCRDQVLLYRRPPTGIWGGLWSLPEVGDIDEIGEWQEINLSLQSPFLSVSENLIRHQFTHFSLDISVANIELGALPEKISDNGNIEFVKLDQISEYALPTPVRRILQQLLPNL